MMTRRKKEAPSSLELFLDTICNTFGGIMFLAILLSVLVQNRTKNLHESTTEHVVTAEEAQALAMRGQRLSDRYAQLDSLIDDLKVLQPRTEDADIDTSAEDLEKLRRALSAELEQQKQLAEKIKQQTAKNAETAETHEEIKRQAEKIANSLADDRRRLQEQLDERMQILQLPHVQSAKKSTVIFLMCFGKVYRLQDSSDKTDTSHLQVIRETRTELIVEPRRDSGWNLTNSVDLAELSEYLATLSSKRYAARVFVWRDSFGQFGDFKHLLVQRDFQYELEPYSTGQSITFVHGSHTPMVQ